MKISFLQLNMNGDTFWDSVIPFLSFHDFDVIHLQEVTGKDTKVGIVDTTRDVFSGLTDVLQDRYKGELAITDYFTSSKEAYMGSATFYKKSFSLIQKEIVWLRKNKEPFSSDAKTFEEVGRALFHLTLSLAGKEVSFLNLHGAWAKTAQEHEHQTQQGEIVINYLKKISSPFILSGDFNLNPQQPTINKIGELARNLTSEHQITNTLNPRKHYAKQLFPPGVAVDYIFVSKDITVKSFRVLDNEDISDHLGLVAEFEI